MQGHQLGPVVFGPDLTAVKDADHPPLRAALAQPHQNIRRKHIAANRQLIRQIRQNPVLFFNIIVNALRADITTIRVATPYLTTDILFEFGNTEQVANLLIWPNRISPIYDCLGQLQSGECYGFARYGRIRVGQCRRDRRGDHMHRHRIDIDPPGERAKIGPVDGSDII